MRFLLFFLLVLSSFAVSVAEEVRVASMNLQNYLIMDRRVEGRWMEEYPKPEKEKEALRRAVSEINPDILAMQEMGPAPFLREFQEDLRKEGQDFPHAILMEAEDDQRHLAVLSKVAPLEVIRHDDLDFPYMDERLLVKRGLLEIVFPLPSTADESWSLFVVHLKSRWSDNDKDPMSSERREKEARAARDRILERYPTGENGFYLIVGDFNDHPGSATVRRFLSRGDSEIAREVPAYDSRGETWTYYYNRMERYERVDYLLVSPALAAFVKGGEGTILDSLFVRKGSDHRPLFVDLTFER